MATLEQLRTAPLEGGYREDHEVQLCKECALWQMTPPESKTDMDSPEPCMSCGEIICPNHWGYNFLVEDGSLYEGRHRKV